MRIRNFSDQTKGGQTLNNIFYCHDFAVGKFPIVMMMIMMLIMMLMMMMMMMVMMMVMIMQKQAETSPSEEINLNWLEEVKNQSRGGSQGIWDDDYEGEKNPKNLLAAEIIKGWGDETDIQMVRIWALHFGRDMCKRQICECSLANICKYAQWLEMTRNMSRKYFLCN